jgi:hypothetical protein
MAAMRGGRECSRHSRNSGAAPTVLAALGSEKGAPAAAAWAWHAVLSGARKGHRGLIGGTERLVRQLQLSDSRCGNGYRTPATQQPAAYQTEKVAACALINGR